MLETRLETAVVDYHKLTEKLAKSEAAKDCLSAELAQKKAENAHLVSSLNEARAQMRFAEQKSASAAEELHARIADLVKKVS